MSKQPNEQVEATRAAEAGRDAVEQLLTDARTEAAQWRRAAQGKVLGVAQVVAERDGARARAEEAEETVQVLGKLLSDARAERDALNALVTRLRQSNEAVNAAEVTRLHQELDEARQGRAVDRHADECHARLLRIAGAAEALCFREDTLIHILEARGYGEWARCLRNLSTAVGMGHPVGVDDTTAGTRWPREPCEEPSHRCEPERDPAPNEERLNSTRIDTDSTDDGEGGEV